MITQSSESNLNSQTKPAGLVVFFKWTSHLAGAVSMLLTIWCALLTLFSVGSNAVILLQLDDYQPAIFVVEELFYSSGDLARDYASGYGAYGRIEGTREYFSLGNYVRGAIRSRTDLEKYVQEGQSLAVMYNPTLKITDKRVLYPEKNFRQKWKQKQAYMIKTGYGPLGLALLICVLTGIVGGVFKTCLGFGLATLVIISLSWLPTLLQLLF
ncbi:hypothetical protein JXQ70_05985 [bacterium]|nr:hypothetical protein [bacterium]